MALFKNKKVYRGRIFTNKSKDWISARDRDIVPNTFEYKINCNKTITKIEKQEIIEIIKKIDEIIEKKIKIGKLKRVESIRLTR